MEMILSEQLLLNCQWTIFVTVVVFLLHFLGVMNRPTKPKVHYQEGSKFVEEVLRRASCLNQNYQPTSLWGKNGHVQTFLHALFGRIGKLPQFSGTRHRLQAPDGSLVTYDVFQPDSKCDIKRDDVVFIVPGICNHSETTYIRAFSHYMTSNGFIVVVHNHTGALPKEELKGSRLFTFGHSDDVDLVVNDMLRRFSVKKVMGIGFSLGGNIFFKYLGEKPERQTKFHMAISVCQGYDVLKGCGEIYKWNNFRRGYNYGMARNYRRVVLNHKEALSKNSTTKYDWQKIGAVSSLQDIDEEVTKKMFKIDDIEKYYLWASSSTYMHNIKIPVMSMNALDDPLVPECLMDAPYALVKENHNAMFITTQHGGHLGFFEGGILIPDRVSWLDRMLAEFIEVSLDVVKEMDFKEPQSNEICS